MSTRLLLIGDIHLREGEHFEDVTAALGFATLVANDRNVHAVVIAGDVFEGATTPEERKTAGEAILNLSFAVDMGSRQVVIVKGNHDKPADLAVYAGYEMVSVAETPIVVTIRDACASTLVDVLCVPWPERAFLAAEGYAGDAGDQAGSAALSAMLRAYASAREYPERPLVVLAHLQVAGAQTSSAQPLIGRAIEATLGDLVDLGAAAVVLGHVHKPQELAPNIHYIGGLTVHDFGEEGEQKRIGILTIEDDGAASWEWVPVPCRRWVTIEGSVSEDGEVEEKWPVITTASEEEAVIAGGLEALAFGANVRYRYHCDESEQHLFDHAEIERRFAGAHTLKIVPEIEKATASRDGAAEVAAARTIEEKLHAYGQAAQVEITPNVVNKLHELEGEASQ